MPRREDTTGQPEKTSSIAINTRGLTGPTTGVQRYTSELLRRGQDWLIPIAPRRAKPGLAGQAWDQMVLPQRLGGLFLFSPANAGPVSVPRQVVTVHDTAVFDCSEGFNRNFAKWHRILLPFLAQRVQRLIAVSEFVKGQIVVHTGIAPAKVSVIPNGVDPCFSPSAARAEETKAALSLPSTRYVLSVGSLEPRKNLGGLLKAWANVQSSLPHEVWLVIAGEAGNRRIFKGSEDFRNIPPRTFFLGRVDERLLPPLYAGATAMVYPSFYEGFGLPPLEAMASGTPVLVANRSALPELVGDAGLLIDPFNVEAIAHGIHTLVNDPAAAAELRRRGLTRAKQFSWDATAEKTKLLLQETIRCNM